MLMKFEVSDRLRCDRLACHCKGIGIVKELDVLKDRIKIYWEEGRNKNTTAWTEDNGLTKIPYPKVDNLQQAIEREISRLI